MKLIGFQLSALFLFYLFFNFSRSSILTFFVYFLFPLSIHSFITRQSWLRRPITGRGGVVKPGTCAGMGRDLFSLVGNFEGVGIGLLLHFRSKIPGERLEGFVAPTPY